MVRIISSETDSQLISNDYSFWKAALIGIVSGILFYLIMILIKNYIIDPTFCSSLSDTLTCQNSLAISGNISMIIVAFIGVVAMVAMQMFQPLIVAAAAAATLWGLAQWLNGLSIVETILWSVLVYGLSYLLYSWISRYKKMSFVLISILIVIAIARIIISL